MNNRLINKQLKTEAEQSVPDVFSRVAATARSQGLLKEVKENAHTSTSDKKSNNRRNRFAAITSIAVAAVLCLAIVLPLTLRAPDTPALTEFAIKDFSRYTALAAGTYDLNGNTKLNIAAYADVNGGGGVIPLADADLTEQNGKVNRLLGVDVYGNISPIEFTKDVDFVQTYGIIQMITYGKFTFIVYERGYSGKLRSDLSVFKNDNIYLVLDNSTGRAYDFAKFGGNAYVGVSDDAFYLRINDKESTVYYKFYVAEDKLEARELFSGKRGGFIYENFSAGFSVDKYGNIFSYDGGETQWAYTTEGQLTETPARVNIGANGIAYCGDKCYNDRGELVEPEFGPKYLINLFNNNAKLVYHDMYRYREDNVYYFYFDRYNYYLDALPSDYNYDGQHSLIVRYEFFDGIKYDVDIFELNKDEEFEQMRGDDETSYNQNFVGVDERLYFLSETEIYYFDMKEKKYVTIASNYIFEKIYEDEIGVIKFEGLNSSLDKVGGIINRDGTVTVTADETDKRLKVYYLFPLD